MNLILFNVEWMSWNLFLACLGVLFGWLTFYSKKINNKVFFFFFYLLFAPNTLYILTDLVHLPEQLAQVYGSIRILLILQYLIFITLGILTYFFSLYIIEKAFLRLFKKSIHFVTPFMIIINFVLAFGVIMGRIMRTNSWYVFTDHTRVIDDAFGVLFTPLYMSYVIAFWLLANIMYFSTRKSPFKKSSLLFAKAQK